MKTSLFLGTALTAMLVTGLASAADTTKNFHASPEAENVPGGSNAAFTADADFTLDVTTNSICGKITLTPTTAPLTGVQIRLGTNTTADGTLILTLPDTAGATAGQIDVNFKNLPAAMVTQIADQGAYLNLDSSDNASTTSARDELADNGENVTACVGTAVDYQAGDAGTDSGTPSSSSSSSSSSSGSTTATPDGGTTTAGDTSDSSSGCNASGSSQYGTVGFLAGLGLVVAAFSRKKKKA